jgi:uncharacterized protein YkwD
MHVARGWRIIIVVCLSLLASGCSATFVSREYAARPVQPLDPQTALVEINTFRSKHGLGPLVLDTRLSRAAAMQAEDQAARNRIGHRGSDGSMPKNRAARAGYRSNIVAENVASGQKSFSDAMRSWEGSSGHRRNLLLPNVNAAGIALAETENGRAYWTLVLGGE